MKVRNIFSRIVVVLLTVMTLLTITGCNNITSNSFSGNEKAKIVISIDKISRTVYPVVSAEELTDFVLSITDSKNIIVQTETWGKYSDLSAAEIEIEEGTYTFELTAKKGGTVLKGATEQSVEVGQTNKLIFNLSIISYGSKDDKGTIDITVYYKKEGTSFDLNYYLIASDGSIDYSGGASHYSGEGEYKDYQLFRYRNTIPVGMYYLVFEMEQGNKIAWKNNYVYVSADLPSAETFVIDEFIPVNTITYDYQLNGTHKDIQVYTHDGSIIDVLEVSDDVNPDLKFCGWYEDPDCSGEEITSIDTLAENGDFTLYAKWELECLYDKVLEINDIDGDTFSFNANPGFLYEITLCDFYNRQEYFSSTRKTDAFIDILLNETTVVKKNERDKIFITVDAESTIDIHAYPVNPNDSIPGECYVYIKEKELPQNIKVTENQDGTFTVDFPLDKKSKYFCIKENNQFEIYDEYFNDEDRAKGIHEATVQSKYVKDSVYGIELMVFQESVDIVNHYCFIGTTQYEGLPDLYVKENDDGSFTIQAMVKEDAKSLYLKYVFESIGSEEYYYKLTDEDRKNGKKTFTENFKLKKNEQYYFVVSQYTEQGIEYTYSYSLKVKHGAFNVTYDYQVDDINNEEFEYVHNGDRIDVLTVSPGMREGFKFAGWYTDTECSGEEVTSLDTNAITDDITLYAKWELISYLAKQITLNNGESRKYTFTAEPGYSYEINICDAYEKSEYYSAYKKAYVYSSFYYGDKKILPTINEKKANLFTDIETEITIEIGAYYNSEDNYYYTGDCFIYVLRNVTGEDCEMTQNQDGTITISFPVKYADTYRIENNAYLFEDEKTITEEEKNAGICTTTFRSRYAEDESFIFFVETGKYRFNYIGKAKYNGYFHLYGIENPDGTFTINVPIQSDSTTIGIASYYYDEWHNRCFLIDTTEYQRADGRAIINIPSPYHKGEEYCFEIIPLTSTYGFFYKERIYGTALYDGKGLATVTENADGTFKVKSLVTPYTDKLLISCFSNGNLVSYNEFEMDRNDKAAGYAEVTFDSVINENEEYKIQIDAFDKSDTTSLVYSRLLEGTANYIGRKCFYAKENTDGTFTYRIKIEPDVAYLQLSYININKNEKLFPQYFIPVTEEEREAGVKEFTCDSLLKVNDYCFIRIDSYTFDNNSKYSNEFEKTALYDGNKVLKFIQNENGTFTIGTAIDSSFENLFIEIVDNKSNGAIGYEISNEERAAGYKEITIDSRSHINEEYLIVISGYPEGYNDEWQGMELTGTALYEGRGIAYPSAIKISINEEMEDIKITSLIKEGMLYMSVPEEYKDVTWKLFNKSFTGNILSFDLAELYEGNSSCVVKAKKDGIFYSESFIFTLTME